MIVLTGIADAQPQFFGQSANNGNIIGISQSGFLGQYAPIQNGQSISNNIIDLTFYNVQYSHNVSINIAYYQSVMTKNGTVLKELRTQIISFYAQQYEIINKNISLYLFKGSFIVEMQYRNINFTFSYSPLPALFPVHINTYGQLALYSVVLLFISLVVFILGRLTAEFMLRRMLYFPKMTISGAILIILLGLIGFFIIFNSIYLRILSIPYYYFVVPVFIMSIALELQIGSGKTKEAVFFGMTGNGQIERIFINKDKNSKSKEYYIGKIPIIDDSIRIGILKGKVIVIDKTSFVKAFKRLFGFYTYLEMPSNMIQYPNKDNTREYYFCSFVQNDNEPMLIQEKREYHLFKNRHLNKPKRYRVNASSNAHIGDVISVMTDLKQIDSLAKENNEYAKENKELRAKIINGSIKADYKFIKEAAQMLTGLYDIVPEFKQKLEAENDKKENDAENKNTDNMEGMYE